MLIKSYGPLRRNEFVWIVQVLDLALAAID